SMVLHFCGRRIYCGAVCGSVKMKLKRGIVEQCCHKPCNILDLEKYHN
uniref:Insulin-like domain-containing protein n=1 Tax=Paramormyrops kingsleyae TaxID=1676925 RepID=A0A3B3T7F2_9TELE